MLWIDKKAKMVQESMERLMKQQRARNNEQAKRENELGDKKSYKSK